jgi:hypothetical protein
MNFQKVFKREDGSKVKVIVLCFVDFTGPIWTHFVQLCDPGKRKFYHYKIDENAATPEEVLQTKMELYKKLLPK